MLHCILIKRKFFEYCEGTLPEREQAKIKRHIDVCKRCRTLIETIGTIERTRKDVPKQSDAFWHNFSVELNQKLDKRGARKLFPLPVPTMIPKPALAFAVAAMVVLAFVFVVPQFQERTALGPLVATPDALMQEILLLEEVTGEALLNHDEEAYLDEIDLLNELETLNERIT